MAGNGITTRRSFHRIWIADIKTLMKQTGNGPRGRFSQTIRSWGTLLALGILESPGASEAILKKMGK